MYEKVYPKKPFNPDNYWEERLYQIILVGLLVFG